MRRHELALFAITILAILPAITNAQYWFQEGARSGTSSFYNSGAKISIQTLLGQNPQSGSVAFWVGETLSNGAFIQAGYLVTNQTGEYPSYCNEVGCSRYINLSKGSAEWFYEYFNTATGQQFLGAVGPNGSAGQNGAFNTYGFYYKNGLWYIFMDNVTLGSVNLGTNSSGPNGPVAFAELANSSAPNTYIYPVKFYNLSYYNGSAFHPVQQGYSYIGYGVGSLTYVPNPYGVSEVGSKVDYFYAGSGLPSPPNGQELWSLGFDLDISSKYGGISGINQYIAYKSVEISAPAVSYLNQSARAVFLGWQGFGPGSYSGSSQASNITLYGNVTELAQWQIQYLLNVSSEFGKASGTGWYAQNSTARYSINSSNIFAGAGERYNFTGWTNGNSRTSGSAEISGPYSISALWQKQYLVNATSPVGGISGAGWYANGSSATLKELVPYINYSSSRRYAFYSWSNGNRSRSISLNVTAPISIGAIFANQSLASFRYTNAYGYAINASSIELGNETFNASGFLFNGRTYAAKSAKYKGATLLLDSQVNINSPSEITIQLPVYNVYISTTDIFGIPLNATLRLQFANGTGASYASGPAGELELYSVPYGEAEISAAYGGEVISSRASSGVPVRITMISVMDIEIFAAVAALGFAMYAYSSRRLSHGKTGPAKKRQ